MGTTWVGHHVDADEARAAVASGFEGVHDRLATVPVECQVDIDKAWHGIHWLLTGDSDPTSAIESRAIFGGEPVLYDDGSTVFLVDPDTVRAVAARLADIPVAALEARHDPGAMFEAEVYPLIWDEEDAFTDYLGPLYEDLRAFYAAAADRGEAVLQTLS